MIELGDRMENPGLKRRRWLKNAIGERSYAWLRLAYRLPVYRRVERCRQLKMQKNLPANAIPLDHDLSIFSPDDLLCHNIFFAMATETHLYEELRGFLRLKEGCTRMLDIGAAAGYFSAVFAQACPVPGRLISVEPEAKSFNLLEETRQLNSKDGLEWLLFNCGVAETDRLVKFKPARSLGTVVDESSPDGIEIPCMTMHSICRQAGFTPDFVKIDIESYEYEVVMSSVDFLKTARPRIHLELHSPQLRERGLDPGDLLRCLDDLGYHAWDRPNGSRRKLTTLLHEYEVQRFDLSTE